MSKRAISAYRLVEDSQELVANSIIQKARAGNEQRPLNRRYSRGQVTNPEGQERGVKAV